tara:strand:- start:369 stop:1475 length:1107 start_codon:yes stop_codon:yes gene_type:complete
MGRRLRLRETTRDVMKLSPWEYMEASFRHRGQARFDDNGNVVTADGKPWIGGLPFPDAKTGVELFAGLTLSWGRHDASFYAIREYDLNRDGKVSYGYENGWAEYAPTGRLVLPGVYWKGHEDKLRYQSVFFTAPDSVRGTSFLNIWHYDQNKFPELYGYIPDFKRIRRFPTDQRFEPLVPGSSLYLSDAWAAGDPLHTWGDYKVVWRGPMLAAVSGGWASQSEDWSHNTHGGPQGETFWDTDVELVPEAIAVDAKPTGFPRAPVGVKRVWFDARTQLPLGMVTFDRRGDLFRSFDGAYGLYEDGDRRVMDGKHPYWSWCHVHAFDVQTGKMTRIEQLAEISGGHRMRVNDHDIYNRYLTNGALRRLGN